ncbi:MAG: hypothetical protein FWC68_03410 [Oscillospiraceae bacterium]|nr:hypothetical protein [Oscillospiraceae bacterium]
MNPEVLGLVASLFVLVSFTVSGEEKIRSVNIIGAIIFVVYGVFIGALSIWILNSILILVHLNKLIKFEIRKFKIMKRKKERKCDC